VHFGGVAKRFRSWMAGALADDLETIASLLRAISRQRSIEDEKKAPMSKGW
jgi:hypothetical protein